jgi:hypothetical protein
MCWLEEFVIDAHLIKVMLESYAGQAVVIHEDLVELPSCYIALNDHHVGVQSSSQVHISGVKS